MVNLKSLLPKRKRIRNAKNYDWRPISERPPNGKRIEAKVYDCSTGGAFETVLWRVGKEWKWQRGGIIKRLPASVTIQFWRLIRRNENGNS